MGLVDSISRLYDERHGWDEDVCEDITDMSEEDDYYGL